MSKPVCQLKFYTGSVLDYTITEDALSVYTKEAVTDQIGHFNIVLPTKKGSRIIYADIAQHDKVKVYFGYGTVDAAPSFVGYVDKISAPLKTETGYIRQISGFSQGEILKRRLKKDKYWSATGASTIVTELANDLSLGTGDITADATAVTMLVETKSYFDVLRDLSDYWLNAGTQIKKDFYVDVDNDLVWKVRPLRTVGVESFTVGDNILDYVVTRMCKPIKNDIKVFGSSTENYPTDKEAYTEQDAAETVGDDGWTLDTGDAIAWDATQKVGVESVKTHAAAAGTIIKSYWTIPAGNQNLVAKGHFDHLHFWMRKNDNSAFTIQIYANNFANRFYTSLGYGNVNVWTEYNLPIGLKYDADWSTNNSPDWSTITDFAWVVGITGGALEFRIDELYLNGGRFSNTATDATSITAYGQRDLEVTDNRLITDSDCQKRAETLLYQLKDELIQIELMVKGNTNVLVGDRLVQTIPAENITAQNYDVISVEHSFVKAAFTFTTKPTMVNSVNIRHPVPQPLKNLYQHVRRLTVDIQDIQ